MGCGVLGTGYPADGKGAWWEKRQRRSIYRPRWCLLGCCSLGLGHGHRPGTGTRTGSDPAGSHKGFFGATSASGLSSAQLPKQRQADGRADKDSQGAESLPFHVPSAPHPPHLSQNCGSEGKAASVNGWERSRRAPASEPAILPVSGASNLQSSHFLAPGALDRTVSH